MGTSSSRDNISQGYGRRERKGRGKGGKREKNAKRYFFKFDNALEYFQKQEPKLYLACI